MSFANYEYELALDLSALQDFSFLDEMSGCTRGGEELRLSTPCVIEGELRLLRDRRETRR